MRLDRFGFVAAFLLLGACSPAPLPPAVSQAEAVAESPATEESETYAPQALAAAEKLLAEAKWLHSEGRSEEAAAAAEEAIAAYSRAFALARAGRADERVESARKAQDEAAAKLAELDRLQAEVAADADAFEMRARVHLDTEEVADVDQLSADRARARQLAARQLSAEARLLCIATHLIQKDAKGLEATEKEIAQLERELGFGSVKVDLYPRAAKARAQCLEHLTKARRPAIKAAPESAQSDRLLVALTETGKLFAFRDDRGIVVNLGSPLDREGKLTEQAEEALRIVGGTAKAHPGFPLLVVAHTAKNGQKKHGEKLGEAAKEALLEAGAPTVRVESVENAQPVVSTRVRGADEKNERVEIVFVTPGR